MSTDDVFRFGRGRIVHALVHHRLRLVVVALVGLGAAGICLLRAQVAKGNGPPPPPSAKELFPDLTLPYQDFGRLAIWSDGMVHVETSLQQQPVGFPCNLRDVALIDQGAEVMFSRKDVAGRPIHRFDGPPRERAEVVYVITGELELEYDEETGSLTVQIQSDATAFSAEFQVSKPAVPGGASVRAEQSSCSCTYNSGTINCSASITCNPGERANCLCNRSGCRANCVRISSLEFQISSIEGAE